MKTELTSIRQSAVAALAQDPYRLDQLAQLAFSSLGSDADVAIGQGALETFERLQVGRRFVKSMRACLAGGAGLAWFEGAYILSDIGDTVRALALRAVIGPLRAAASQTFNGELTALLIDVRSSNQAISHTVHEIRGLGHIVIAGYCPADALPAVLAHELAHCHFRCGNRFLDEGLAVYFETLHVRRHNFPMPRDALGSFLDSAREHLPLRRLLGWSQESILPPKGADMVPTLDTLVYAQAWKLIDTWIERLGIVTALTLCRDIGAAPTSDLDAVVKRSTHWDIRETEQQLFSRVGGESSSKTWSIQFAQQALMEAALGGKNGDLKDVCLWLRSQLKQLPGDAVASEALGKSILLQLLQGPDVLVSGPEVAASFEEASALVKLLFSSDDLPKTRHALLLRAMLHTVEALIRGKTRMSLESLERSIFYYDAAVKAAPRDPEVLVAAGTFFAHLPPGVGTGAVSGRVASKRHDDGVTQRTAMLAEAGLQ